MFAKTDFCVFQNWTCFTKMGLFVFDNRRLVILEMPFRCCVFNAKLGSDQRIRDQESDRQ